VTTKQEVNAPLIVTVGVVSGLLLLVVVFGTQAWFVREEREEIADKWSKSEYVQLDELRAAQRAKIQAKGPTTIPIAQAMQVIVQTGGKLPTTQPNKK
jgi:hypothetical protein